jgi:diguanylate cyclase (GGDEF)-like protein
VLRQFAELLRANLQRDDLVARWGGEEFLLLLPQTPALWAVAVAERLRSCLHEASWPAGLQVRASFGVADCTTAAEMSEALRAADQAMYEAKSFGRDRVEIAIARHLG